MDSDAPVEASWLPTTTIHFLSHDNTDFSKENKEKVRFDKSHGRHHFLKEKIVPKNYIEKGTGQHNLS